jgi:lipopolysaccharide transport system permease protein
MDSRIKTAIYDASGMDRIAITAWKVMCAELWEFRELIRRLVYRNIAGQFRQSFLGYLWIALPPVATAFVFSVLKSANIVQVEMPVGGMPYALFALVGATVWGFFSQAAMMATQSVYGAGILVSKVYFPREVLVLSSVGNALINLVVRLLVVGLTMALLGYAPSWQAVLALPLLIPVFALALGIGLFFAPLNTMMNDTGRILDFVFQFGLFLAPTIYPTPALDFSGPSWNVILHFMHVSNPVSHFLYAIQSLIEGGGFVWTPGLIASTIFSFLVLFAGWRFFHICEPMLAERI